jgi:hypothetical protein
VSDFDFKRYLASVIAATMMKLGEKLATLPQMYVLGLDLFELTAAAINCTSYEL